MNKDESGLVKKDEGILLEELRWNADHTSQKDENCWSPAGYLNEEG